METTIALALRRSALLTNVDLAPVQAIARVGLMEKDNVMVVVAARFAWSTATVLVLRQSAQIMIARLALEMPLAKLKMRPQPSAQQRTVPIKALATNASLARTAIPHYLCVVATVVGIVVLMGSVLREIQQQVSAMATIARYAQGIRIARIRSRFAMAAAWNALSTRPASTNSELLYRSASKMRTKQLTTAASHATPITNVSTLPRLANLGPAVALIQQIVLPLLPFAMEQGPVLARNVPTILIVSDWV